MPSVKVFNKSISLNGDEFDSDQEYFEQIPGFLDKLDKISEGSKWYGEEDLAWNL